MWFRCVSRPLDCNCVSRWITRRIQWVFAADTSLSCLVFFFFEKCFCAHAAHRQTGQHQLITCGKKERNIFVCVTVAQSHESAMVIPILCVLAFCWQSLRAGQLDETVECRAGMRRKRTKRRTLEKKKKTRMERTRTILRAQAKTRLSEQSSRATCWLPFVPILRDTRWFEVTDVGIPFCVLRFSALPLLLTVSALETHHSVARSFSFRQLHSIVPCGENAHMARQFSLNCSCSCFTREIVWAEIHVVLITLLCLRVIAQSSNNLTDLAVAARSRDIWRRS